MGQVNTSPPKSAHAAAQPAPPGAAQHPPILRPQYSLIAEEACLPGHLESRREFQQFRNRMFEDLAPADAVEGMLADWLVAVIWRKRRLCRIEREIYERAVATPAAPKPDPPRPNSSPAAPPLQPLIANPSDPGRLMTDGTIGCLDWLHHHEAHLDRAVLLALRELDRYRYEKLARKLAEKAACRD